MSKQITYKDIEPYIYANYEEIAWTRAYKGLDPDILVKQMQQRYREDPKEVRRLLRRREGELSYAQAMAYTRNYAMGKLGKTEEEAERYARVNWWRHVNPTWYQNEQGEWVRGTISDVYREAKNSFKWSKYGNKKAAILISRRFFGSL